MRALMVALSKYIIALGNHVNAFNSADHHPHQRQSCRADVPPAHGLAKEIKGLG